MSNLKKKPHGTKEMLEKAEKKNKAEKSTDQMGVMEEEITKKYCAGIDEQFRGKIEKMTQACTAFSKELKDMAKKHGIDLRKNNLLVPEKMDGRIQFNVAFSFSYDIDDILKANKRKAIQEHLNKK